MKEKLLEWFAAGLARTAAAIGQADGQGAIPCLFHTMTGIYCPGCGGTRAVCALLAGRIGESFLLHPLVPYAAVSAAALLVWYLYCRKKKKTFSQKLWKNVLLVGIVLLCANFLIKNGALLFAHTDLLRRWS